MRRAETTILHSPSFFGFQFSRFPPEPCSPHRRLIESLLTTTSSTQKMGKMWTHHYSPKRAGEPAAIVAPEQASVGAHLLQSP